MKLGDHIRILKDGAWLHAIDVGDRTAISFSTPGGARRAQLSELASGAQKVEVVTHTERVYAPKAVVARAFSRFSVAAFAAMFADSEAFATWCKSGRQLGATRNGAAASLLAQSGPAARPAAAAEIAPEPVEPVRRSARVAKARPAATAKSARARKLGKAAAPAQPKRATKGASRPRAGAAKGAAKPARKAATARGGSAKRGARPARGAARRGAAARPSAAKKRGVKSRPAARRRA